MDRCPNMEGYSQVQTDEEERKKGGKGSQVNSKRLVSLFNVRVEFIRAGVEKRSLTGNG